ncbi:MAG: GH92 family glycosyl hydrolase [Limisphaerales bacterium]
MKLKSIGFGAALLLFAAANTATAATRLSDYIRPFVGTEGEGNTYPGPSAPFGMVQISPDTDTTNWSTASGYEYTDPTIHGFSLTHLSGTGCPDLGDFLFAPQVGGPYGTPGTKDHPEAGYQSAFSHADEVASAGYYKVKLLRPGIIAELTAGERAGMMRFTFPATNAASILIDLNHFIDGGRGRVIESRVRLEDKQTVTGFHLVNNWAPERYLYFAARFSRPFDDAYILVNGKAILYNSYQYYRFHSRKEASSSGIGAQFLAQYATHEGEVIQVKVAVSTVSTANALQNLDSEIPDWDFEKVRETTRARWDKELARIEIDGTQQQKETFYTSLYHSLLVPNLHQDVNGEYRGFDQNFHRTDKFTKYTIFSLWDTFRAEHPLLALIQSKRDSDMINSLLAHYDQSVDHLLPMWELQGNETWCMIGYHAVPVIVDGYLKGVTGFDAQHAYEAITNTAMNADYDGLAAYRQLGWVPSDQENESVSKTLEYAYDDWCIAQMAKALGKESDYAYYMKRAGSFTNIFNPTTGWMHSKDAAGKWAADFDPYTFGGVRRYPADVTEGTSSQYSWYAPHDVPGLVKLMGGTNVVIEKLDTLFATNRATKVLPPNDQRGCIGDYWHGNEPSHHIIYLYSYLGQPWKAAKLLHQVITTQYGNTPNSLCGNDDCGQMSAWYLFTCMGFYPVCPGSDYYVIGAPQLPKATMHLSNGKDWVMTAENISDKNIYVQSVKLNGKNWDSPFLPFNELKNGGTIAFKMGAEPSQTWGTHPQLP